MYTHRVMYLHICLVYMRNMATSVMMFLTWTWYIPGVRFLPSMVMELKHFWERHGSASGGRLLVLKKVRVSRVQHCGS